MSSPAKLVLFLDDGGELELPSTFIVCGRCEGRGSHVNPAIDGHGITAEEWNGPDWDEDSREGYMAGRYDVACHRCGGARVVPIADYSKMSQEEIQAWERQLQDLADLEAEEAAERRLGC